MKRNYGVYLEDILESIEKIFTYTKGKTESDFTTDTQLQDAVLRRFEIIGEAVKRIPVYSRIFWGASRESVGYGY